MEQESGLHIGSSIFFLAHLLLSSTDGLLFSPNHGVVLYRNLHVHHRAPRWSFNCFSPPPTPLLPSTTRKSPAKVTRLTILLVCSLVLAVPTIFSTLFQSPSWPSTSEQFQLSETVKLYFIAPPRNAPPLWSPMPRFLRADPRFKYVSPAKGNSFAFFYSFLSCLERFLVPLCGTPLVRRFGKNI